MVNNPQEPNGAVYSLRVARRQQAFRDRTESSRSEAAEALREPRAQNLECTPLNVSMDAVGRLLWHVGWDLRPTYGLMAGLAIIGWVLLKNPVGLTLGLLGLVPRWKSLVLINKSWETFLAKAELSVQDQGAIRLGVTSDAPECTVIRAGRGRPPLGVRANPEYCISVFYICEAFFAVYQGAILNLRKLQLQLPAQGEEVYFRHVSAVKYNHPNVEVVLSNGKTMREFNVGADGSARVMGALKAKLRGANLDSVALKKDVLKGAEIRASSAAPQTLDHISQPNQSDSPEESGNETRYCYLQHSKLMRLLNDQSVLDVLVEQLQVPGARKTQKQLTPQEKMEYIESIIDFFRRTPISMWYGVPSLEVLAASIWRAGEDSWYRERGLLTKKLVRREWFSGVSQEDDLRIPIAKWLKTKGYDPYMEIPLGLGRVDVFGFMKSGIGPSTHLIAVELKNEYEQFKRAFNQMATFAEYTNAVFMACTPDFAAEYLAGC